VPRNLLDGLLFYPIGLALAAAGALAAAWIVLAIYAMQQAFDVALWALRHAPMRFDAPVEAIAQDLMRPDKRVAQSAIAALMAFVGWTTLRGARTSLRPATASDDGKFEIELEAPQLRLGEKVGGKLRFLKAPGLREMFRLELRCKRFSRDPDGKERNKVVFAAYQDVAASEDPRGGYIAFSFDVPADAPASCPWNWINPQFDVFKWQLAVYRADALIAAGSWFDLQVVAPAGNPPPAPDAEGWRGLLPRPLAIALSPGPMDSTKLFLRLVLMVFVVLPIVVWLVKSVASLF
jgi:hypothetical protein